MIRRTKTITALLAAAGLTFLIVGWPVAAHYRATSRLEGYKSRLTAKGEKLAIAELVPTVSAEDVSAADALMAAAARLRPSSPLSNFPPVMRLTSPGRTLVSWKEPILSNGEVSNVWAGLSLVLAQNADTLEEIRETLQSPSFAFNLQYQQGFSLLLPHLAKLKGLAQWLCAATIFDLHEGRAAEAAKNLRALTALVQGNQKEALMISELVRVAMAAIAVTAAWEALQSSDWRDEELKELQRAWASVDLLSQAEAALAMERAMAAKAFVAARESYSVISGGGFSSGTAGSGLAELTQLGKDMLDNPKEGLRNLAHRYPGYWHWRWWQSYDDELAKAEVTQATLEAVRQLELQYVFGTALKDLEKSAALARQAHPQAGRWLGWSMDSEILTRFLARVSRIEMERSLLVTAITLKRYKLKYGTYPAELAALAPEFVEKVPRDPIDGQPLRYRLQSDGSFLLYSVGEDGQDNGGDATAAESSPKQWSRARDAVWPRPATAEEAKVLTEKLAAEWKANAEKAARTAGSLSAAELEFRKRYGLELPNSSPTNANTNQPVK